MSNVIKNPLFQLIKSLTKSEKRYFKLCVSLNQIKEFNHYVALFDTIEKQESYSKITIYKELSDIIKNIPSTKYHLYFKILESLELFHRGKQIDSTIMKGINQAEILASKSMFKESYALLRKIKKTAYANERHTFILTITLYERRLLLKFFLNQKVLKNNLAKLFQEEVRIYRLLSIENKLSQLAYKVDMYVKEKGNELRSNKDRKLFNEIKQHPVLKINEKEITSYSKKLKYYIFQNYYLLFSDYPQAEIYAQKTLDLTEATLDKHNRQQVVNYINTTANLMLVQVRAKKFGAALKSIKKIKSIPSEFNLKDTDEGYIKVLQYGDIEHLSLLNHIGQFDKSIEIGKQFLPLFYKFKSIITKEYILVFLGNYAYTCFALKQYKESLFWINEIYKLPKDLLREDIMVSMKILNLVNNFELNNSDFLEYINIATHRYFKKQKKVYKVESTIVSFIQRFAKINKNEELNEFRKLKVILTEILKSPYESSALDPLDFISWIDSKLLNKTFAEVVKEKVKQAGSVIV